VREPVSVVFFFFFFLFSSPFLFSQPEVDEEGKVEIAGTRLGGVRRPSLLSPSFSFPCSRSRIEEG